MSMIVIFILLKNKEDNKCKRTKSHMFELNEKKKKKQMLYRLFVCIHFNTIQNNTDGFTFMLYLLLCF